MSNKNKRPPMEPLDPMEFQRGWDKAMLAAEGIDAVPSDEPMSLEIEQHPEPAPPPAHKVRNPIVRLTEAMQRSFENPLHGANAALRMHALMGLMSSKKLGPFAKADAIHQSAIRAAGEARWTWLRGGGFDFEDFRKKCMKHNRLMYEEAEKEEREKAVSS